VEVANPLHRREAAVEGHPRQQEEAEVANRRQCLEAEAGAELASRKSSWKLFLPPSLPSSSPFQLQKSAHLLRLRAPFRPRHSRRFPPFLCPCPSSTSSTSSWALERQSPRPGWWWRVPSLPPFLLWLRCRRPSPWLSSFSFCPSLTLAWKVHPRRRRWVLQPSPGSWTSSWTF